jgi:hypothetical protein
MAAETKAKKTEVKCDDRNCPIHGSLKTRGQIIKGNVVSDKMQLRVTKLQ